MPIPMPSSSDKKSLRQGSSGQPVRMRLSGPPFARAKVARPPRISSVVEAKKVELLDRLAMIEVSIMRSSRSMMRTHQSRRYWAITESRLGTRFARHSAKRE